MFKFKKVLPSVNFFHIVLIIAAAMYIFCDGPGANNNPIQPAEMILVEQGSFLMGQSVPPLKEEGNSKQQQSGQEVWLDSFYIGKYEVTVKEFGRFVEETGYTTTAEQLWGAYVKVVKPGPKKENLFVQALSVNWKNPDFQQTEACPVTCVSWYDAVEYCNWRSKKQGLVPCYTINKKRVDKNNISPYDLFRWTVTCDFKANGYRLPTEAEWEYAARGGIKTKGYIYSGSNDAAAVAWYGENSGNKTHPVGQKKPNELGIFDMTGNVWEWCWDWYNQDYYKDRPAKNPVGCSYGEDRIELGGTWSHEPSLLPVAVRSHSNVGPFIGSQSGGFRLASSAK